MKKVIILILFGTILSSCGGHSILNSGKAIAKKFSTQTVLEKDFKVQVIPLQADFFKRPSSEEDYTLFFAIQRIFAFVVLLSVLLIIMGVPVLLGFYWIENLFCYHEECKKNVLVNTKDDSKKNKPPCLSDRQKYKRTISSLYGNGFGFVGWVGLTLWHLIVSYDSFSEGLRAYFSFPFVAVRNLDIRQSNLFNQVSSDVWASMLFIVGTSMLFYVIGRFVGSSIAIKSLRKANFYYLNIDA